MAQDFDFSRFEFAPVVRLPAEYVVFDFSKGPMAVPEAVYGIGRYAEKRPGVYQTEHYREAKPRDIHVGIDLAAPAETPVHAFYGGRIFLNGINPAAGDYGGTLITEHDLGDRRIWALHGHLEHDSVLRWKPGQEFQRGEEIARLGKPEENGGWPPHLHFQLSWKKPERCDLPGVVNDEDLAEALKLYPDPRLVLGPLY